MSSSIIQSAQALTETIALPSRMRRLLIEYLDCKI